MRIQSLIVSLISLVAITSTTTIPMGCANIVPPQGGPRDTIPPVLLKATPVEGATRVNSNRLVFSFDEFVELQNAQQEVIVSPLPAVPPTIESKLKEVSVRLRDSLEPNTTYSIQFGNAIKDYNEGNVLKNFRYTFSTGAQLDSGRIKGRLVSAETGKPDSTLIAVLHRSDDDSAIINQRPAYITRLNGRGEFQFEQLPNHLFYLYAIKDDGGMRRLMGNDGRVAFADSAIRPEMQPTSLTLYAFDLKEKTTSTGVTAAPPMPTPGIKGKPGGATGSERRLRYSNNLSEGKQDLLSDLELTSEQMLIRFDSTRIRVYMDSSFKPVAGYTLLLDSSKRKIRLRTNWFENTVYRIVIDKDALKDTLDRQLLKSDTISFTTRKRSDYGKLSIRLRNIPADSMNPVIQLVMNDAIVAAAPLGSDGSFRRELFLPGTYEIRILYDINKNGRWDAGQLFPTRRQPERVRPLDRKITVKSGWENEFEF